MIEVIYLVSCKRFLAFLSDSFANKFVVATRCLCSFIVKMLRQSCEMTNTQSFGLDREFGETIRVRGFST